MGVQFKQGFDTLVDDATNITGSATGWASRTSEVMEALKSTNNELGTAALANAVSTNTAGAVPMLDSSGKIAVAQIATAIAGGAGSAGLIPLLNSSGQLPSSMVSGSSGGGGSGGIKGLWFYSNTDQAGNTGSYSSTDRYWQFTWRPNNAQGSYTGATTVLIIATGGGGAGAHGPAATVSNGGPGGVSVAGHAARKGGGGAAGSTVIAFKSAITSTSTLTVRVGEGGDSMPSTGPTASNNGGYSSVSEVPLSAGGGSYGLPAGNGGTANQSSVGNANLAFQLYGGAGGDGTFDRLGAGGGGASFWGGGYNAGEGRNDGSLSFTRHVAPGGGGGAAHGSSGTSPFTFTPNRPGFAGAHGCVCIIGFG